MSSILQVTFPFFALVLCGYLASRSGVLPSSAVPGLNAFVLYFALPCMLLRFGLGTPVRELAHPVLLGAYLIAGGAIVALALWRSRRQGLGLRDASFGALVAAFPNSGFMGFPLLGALLGPAAAGPVINTLLIDLVLISSLCLALARLQDTQGHGLWASLRTALARVAANPLPWSIALGAALGESGWTLPGPVAQVIKMLGDAASPVALFTIGAVLWRSSHLGPQGEPAARSSMRGVGGIAVMKLVLHPLLVWGLCRIAMAFGSELTAVQITALTLTAALPSASNVALLTERFGADTGRVARIILVTTVLAFLSFSTLAYWMT